MEGARRQSSSLVTSAIAVFSVFVKGKTCPPNLGDGHSPLFMGNREGFFSAAKTLHNGLWIGAED